MTCGLYYQANVKKSDAWFFTAVLRSFEHVAFDRTVTVEESLFEFFVPEAMNSYFLEIMTYFQEQGYISNLQRLPNRLCP